VVAAAVILPVSASAYLAYRNASLVSTSVPKTMVAGSTYKVTFKMKNTGRYTWTYVSDYKLRARGGSDPFTRVLSYRVAKKDRITTGHSKTFTITMKAPSKPGVYTTDWRMHRGTLEFGPVVSRKVTVVAPALTGITLTKAPTKVHYLTGEALDLTGLVVTGTYNNGTTAVVPVTAANITGFSSDAVAAAQTVTITVGGKTATFVIDVADAGTFHVSTLEQLKAAVAKRLDHVQTILVRSLSELRRYIHDLRPLSLNTLGLIGALHQRLNEIGDARGVSVRVYTEGDERALPPGVEAALYRVAQEAVTNIAKHAEAKHAIAILRFAATSVHLTVEDDGIGFDLKDALDKVEREESLGLKSMRERVQNEGGTFSITSGRRGTTLKVDIPC
jgi:hypothetical protein